MVLLFAIDMLFRDSNSCNFSRSICHEQNVKHCRPQSPADGHKQRTATVNIGVTLFMNVFLVTGMRILYALICNDFIDYESILSISFYLVNNKDKTYHTKLMNSCNSLDLTIFFRILWFREIVGSRRYRHVSENTTGRKFDRSTTTLPHIQYQMVIRISRKCLPNWYKIHISIEQERKVLSPMPPETRS